MKKKSTKSSFYKIIQMNLLFLSSLRNHNMKCFTQKKIRYKLYLHYLSQRFLMSQFVFTKSKSRVRQLQARPNADKLPKTTADRRKRDFSHLQNKYGELLQTKFHPYAYV